VETGILYSYVAACILNIDAIWKEMISFKFRPSHPQRKSQSYSRFGGLQSRTGRFEDEINILPKYNKEVPVPLLYSVL
jgi:hypothetical protein